MPTNIFDPTKPYGNRYNFLSTTADSITPRGGNWPGSAQGAPNPALSPNTGQGRDDYAVYDVGSQSYINSRTKIPWTGELPGGNYAHQGKLAPAPTLPPGADPNRYRGVEVPKNPDIDAANNDLLARFKEGADKSLKSFNEHLATFNNGATAAYNAGRAATDTTGFETNYRGAVDRYGNRLDAAAADYRTLNADDAARQRDIVSRANALLPEYDAAAAAIGDRQLQLLGAQVNRYKLGSGTPRSLGGDELQLYQSGAADVLLPLQREKIARRYDLLQNLELPVERDITGRETNRISQFEPMVAGAQFNSQAEAERAIQSVKMAASSQNWQNVLQMMQVPAVAAEVKNRILAGDAQLLALITQLRGANRYQGLEDTRGVQVSQPVGYNFSTPGYPTANRYSQPNQPIVTTSGGGTLARRYDPISQSQMDKLNASLAVDPVTGRPAYAGPVAGRYAAPVDYDPQNGSFGRY